MSEYTSVLRGLSFRPMEAKVIAADLIEGDLLLLRREPDNAYDPNAVMVIHPDYQVHLGYIAKEVAPDLAAEMDEGKVFNCSVSSNMMKQIILDIYPFEDSADRDYEEA